MDRNMDYGTPDSQTRPVLSRLATPESMKQEQYLDICAYIPRENEKSAQWWYLEQRGFGKVDGSE